MDGICEVLLPGVASGENQPDCRGREETAK